MRTNLVWDLGLHSKADVLDKNLRHRHMPSGLVVEWTDEFGWCRYRKDEGVSRRFAVSGQMLEAIVMEPYLFETLGW